MTRSTAWCAIALALALSLLSAPLAAAGLESIRITQVAGSWRHLQPWQLTGPVPESVDVELGLGDEIEGAVLALQPSDGDTDTQYRVMTQFETSLALGDDGPHIDLLDWRHCRSQWRPAIAAQAGTWHLPEAGDDERACFPASSAGELVEATRRALADLEPADRARWLALARSVAVVGEAPSYVSISAIRVRIDTLTSEGWRALTTLVFRIPMGC